MVKYIFLWLITAIPFSYIMCILYSNERIKPMKETLSMLLIRNNEQQKEIKRLLKAIKEDV